MDEKVDRLLHDVQHKVNGAVFALTLAAHIEGSHDRAVAALREVDEMIDTFAEEER